MGTDFKGRQPEENRLIVYAHADGMVYDVTIIEFVILQAARAISRTGVPTENITPEMVSQATPECASALIEDGWFTDDEYSATWAAEQVEDLDEELRNLPKE